MIKAGSLNHLTRDPALAVSSSKPKRTPISRAAQRYRHFTEFVPLLICLPSFIMNALYRETRRVAPVHRNAFRFLHLKLISLCTLAA